MMKKVQKKVWFSVLLLFVSCCAVGQVTIYVALRPTPSREELCQALTEYIETQECKGLTVTQTITKAFQPGITTRSQIQHVLGEYLVKSRISSESGRSSDSYHLDGNWLGDKFGLTLHTFRFSQEGVYENLWVQE
jgi:hypothetical protein